MKICFFLFCSTYRLYKETPPFELMWCQGTEELKALYKSRRIVATKNGGQATSKDNEEDYLQHLRSVDTSTCLFSREVHKPPGKRLSAKERLWLEADLEYYGDVPPEAETNTEALDARAGDSIKAENSKAVNEDSKPGEIGDYVEGLDILQRIVNHNAKSNCLMDMGKETKDGLGVYRLAATNFFYHIKHGMSLSSDDQEFQFRGETFKFKVRPPVPLFSLQYSGQPSKK